MLENLNVDMHAAVCELSLFKLGIMIDITTDLSSRPQGCEKEKTSVPIIRKFSTDLD